MSILLPRAEIAIPSADKLHPQLHTALDAIRLVAADTVWNGLPVYGSPALAHVNALCTYRGCGAYAIPYLSPEYCDELVQVLNGAGYDVNQEEVPQAQIPEIVLQHRSKPLFDCLSVLWANVGVPLSNILWNLNADVIGSIQAAQYSPATQPGTAWHHDQDSDVTVVVNLGTEFEGGGTEIAAGLCEPGCTIPPLKKGHALFFKGRTQLHRGLPVTSGTRTLLVHWATIS